MSSDITIEAVRLALGMQEMRARVASVNIANASQPDAHAMRVDFAAQQGLLSEIAQTQEGSAGRDMAARLQQALQGLRGTQTTTTGKAILSDEQIADMVSAGANYQALSEALSRHFGLMRLAVAGRI